MSIAQFEGKALVFNNGVVDVKQGDVSLVDENKVAHIPVSNAEIDNKTIITNANNKLEVPFDNQTIYVDQDGFIKARGGGSGSTDIDGLTLVKNDSDQITTSIGGFKTEEGLDFTWDPTTWTEATDTTDDKRC